MSVTRYALIVLGASAAALAAAWPALAPESRAAVLLGAALSAGNSVAAYFLAVWSLDRPPNVFVGAVLGGMVARMGFLLAAFAAAVKLLGLPVTPFAAAMLGSFAALLVFELALLHRRTSARAEAR